MHARVTRVSGTVRVAATTLAVLFTLSTATSALADSVTLADDTMGSPSGAPAPPASAAQAVATAAATPGSPSGSSVAAGQANVPLTAAQLAKQINNPVTDLWQLQFQFNNVKLETGNTPVSAKWVYSLDFQPVLPVKLTEHLNLITRPVLTLYNSTLVPTGPLTSRRATAFGDTILASVLSPAGLDPWIVAAGPTFVFPTAGSYYTGQGKWQIGPAVGGGYIVDKFMVAALFQQWFSFAGNPNRRTTSQLNILPLIYRFWEGGWSLGYSGDILADWEARNGQRWTVPVGLAVGKVVRIGILPVQIQIGGQYFAARPTGGPNWNVQITVTPVIPKLIKQTLFH